MARARTCVHTHCGGADDGTQAPCPAWAVRPETAGDMAAFNEKTASSCRKLLAGLMARAEAAPFLEPVAWKEWGLLDYPQLIKHPMDLGLVLVRARAGGWGSRPSQLARAGAAEAGWRRVLGARGVRRGRAARVFELHDVQRRELVAHLI